MNSTLENRNKIFIIRKYLLTGILRAIYMLMEMI